MLDVLVTAGATRNPIDAMRFLSARSSGRTSVAIARHLAGVGCRVTLMGSPEALLRGADLPGIEFGDTHDLMAKMKAWVLAHPGAAVVHACAVGDYELASPDKGKISSEMDELVLRLRPTPKIADHVKVWDPSAVLVTFKAAPPETDAEELIRVCRAQLARTHSDLVLGNVIGALAVTTTLVDEDGSEAFDDRDAALRTLAARVRAAATSP